MAHKIVFLDRGTVRASIPPEGFAQPWTNYPATAPEQVVERLRGATIAVTNKVAIREAALALLPDLKLIAVAATGYDCVDVAACRARGVAVANVPSYASDAVAEHVLMLALALRRNLIAYHEAVRAGRWARSDQFALSDFPIQNLAGQTLAIIGYGQIGQKLAALAKAFGMRVVLADRKGVTKVRPGRVAFEEALAEADVLSIHSPLAPETRGMIGAAELALMKRSAILINTARGGIVDEGALADALRAGKLGGAGVDVLSQEPPRGGNPLLELKQPNLIVTPHVAWSSEQAQERLVGEVIANIEAFIQGRARNLV